MKATINLEFTSDELKSYLINAAVETIARVLTISPDLFTQVIGMMGTATRGVGAPHFHRPGPPPFAGFGIPFGVPQQGPFAGGQPPGPFGASLSDLNEVLKRASAPKNGAPHVEHCFHIEETRNMEAGWGCCRCATYNGTQRTACRHCAHERCTPNANPPSPGPTGAPESAP